VCVFCRQINYQRTNHRHHLIMKHKCWLDGTQATTADIQQAKIWSSSQPTGCSTRYKSPEFVDSESNDDTTPVGSGASTPSRHGSPSPPEVAVRKERGVNRPNRHRHDAIRCHDALARNDQRRCRLQHLDQRHRLGLHRLFKNKRSKFGLRKKRRQDYREKPAKRLKQLRRRS